MELAKKYMELLQNGKIDYIILYNEQKAIPNNNRIMKWSDFLKVG